MAYFFCSKLSQTCTEDQKSWWQSFIQNPASITDGSVQTLPEDNRWYLDQLPKYTVPKQVFNAVSDAGLFEVAKKELVKKKMYSGRTRKCMEEEVWMVDRIEAESEQDMDVEVQDDDDNEGETPIIRYEENDKRNGKMVAFKDDFDNWRVGSIVGEGNKSYEICIYSPSTSDQWEETPCDLNSSPSA